MEVGVKIIEAISLICLAILFCWIFDNKMTTKGIGSKEGFKKYLWFLVLYVIQTAINIIWLSLFNLDI